jgi:hypothetical protein
MKILVLILICLVLIAGCITAEQEYLKQIDAATSSLIPLMENIRDDLASNNHLSLKKDGKLLENEANKQEQILSSIKVPEQWKECHPYFLDYLHQVELSGNYASDAGDSFITYQNYTGTILMEMSIAQGDKMKNDLDAFKACIHV